MPDWREYSARYHTTTEQLADIANHAKARLVVIYHVSGRTPDEQLLAEVQKNYRGKVVIAHDLDVY